MPGTLSLLEDVDKHFCYLRRYGVLFCKDHSTGVLNLSLHLRRFHSITSKQRIAITQHFYDQNYPITPAQDIALPAALSPPIEELGLPLDGLACKQDGCSFLTISMDALRIHAKKQHSIAWKGNTAALYTTGIKVQTFFKSGGLQRYFIVDAGQIRSSSSTTLSTRNPTTDTVKEQLAEWDATKQVHKEKAQIMDAEVAKTDKTGWFKRTGWLEHFANRNLMHLAY